jgi:hypothetical protein
VPPLIRAVLAAPNASIDDVAQAVNTWGIQVSVIVIAMWLTKIRAKTTGESIMHYLYGSKQGVPHRLVATFGSEPQLLAYVRWATLQGFGNRRGKFEQGSALASYEAWEQSAAPLTGEEASNVLFNPTPSML